MYSRSYGSIETEGKKESLSIPADYNGNLYRSTKKTQTLPEKEDASVEPSSTPAAQTTGMFSNLLEKFTAEDIILFVLVFSLLKEDGDDLGAILAIILALLLL